MKKNDLNKIPNDYAQLLLAVKDRVRSAQYAALKVVNKELVGLYWDIGQMIVERQAAEGWGRSVVKLLSKEFALPCGN